MAFVCILTLATCPFVQATQHAYARQDPDVLRSLFERADSRSDSLLIRYRLYPLTEETALLENIPESMSEATAREYALLSGLWAYRAGEASVLSAIRYGRRSAHLLERAEQQDAHAPFVLLVGGQSLLFRPSLVGGDAVLAVERFVHLDRILNAENTSGISRTEAQVWRWLALREADRPRDAEALRRELQKRDLAPLYKQFLNDPPDV